MQKAPEERRKVKQNYWFLTNETTYLNGQQPHGRRDRRRGRRGGGEPEGLSFGRRHFYSAEHPQEQNPAGAFLA